MIDPATLRAEAETLARALPDVALKAAAADSVHLGSAGRKQAGTGEQFWQYRHYAQEDAAQRVDWRRSARGDDLYVRESELETSRTVLFWADGSPGFDWRGSDERRTKGDAARILLLTLGSKLARDGERIGMLDGARPPGYGKAAVDRLADALATPPAGDGLPTPPRKRAIAVLASDFYDPLPVWRERLSAIANGARQGVLLAVSDPIEVEFPWKGRVRFSRPGSALSRIFGRAEQVRETYLETFKAHFEGLRALADGMGWQFVTYRTDEALLTGAARLVSSVEQFGLRRG